MDGVANEEADTTALPDGYDSVDAFLTEARKRFQEGQDSDRENRDAALDDLKFIAGQQWDETVQSGRIRKGRPCLTINTLPQYVGQVIGDTRANRPSIKVRPTEDGDVKIAEARQGLIRFIENTSNATQVYALAGEDQVSCGLGHFRVSLAYSNDDSFDQDIKLSHIVNPFSVVWDAQSVEPTGADAEFCFVNDEVDRKTFEKAYPDAQTTDLTTNLTAEGWVSRDTVRVTEYWLMKTTTRKLALVQRAPEAEAKVEDITDKEDEAKAFIVPGPDGKPRTREKQVRSACMYLITGKEILEGPFELPIQRLPVFKVTGREVRVAEKRYRYGLIRFAKDPIRMKNLWRSSAAEFLAMSPKQQWLLHETDEKKANRFRQAHKSDDPVLVWSGATKPERMDPPMAPAALLQESQINDADIKDVTGLHDASLGMHSNETSGVAIRARESQGDTATFMYHDNLAASIREAGRVVNDLLPVVYDRARTITILGEDGTSTPQRINDPNHPESIDLGNGKYDVVVETGPSYATKRVEAAESMMAFMQSQPQAAGQIGDLVAKSQDWPMADEIAARLRKALPPGLAEDDDQGLTPEQQAQKQQQIQAAQQAQQQAQAMQQKAAELALEERAAKIDGMRADAAYKMAQAHKAMQPPEQTGQPTDLDVALKLAEIREANANADAAEANAVSAWAKANITPVEALTAVHTLNRALSDHEQALAAPPEAEAGGAGAGSPPDDSSTAAPAADE